MGLSTGKTAASSLQRPWMLSLQHICTLLVLILSITAVLIHISIISKLKHIKCAKLKEQLEPLKIQASNLDCRWLHQNNSKVYIKCIKLAKYFFRAIRIKLLGCNCNIHLPVNSVAFNNGHCTVCSPTSVIRICQNPQISG